MSQFFIDTNASGLTDIVSITPNSGILVVPTIGGNVSILATSSSAFSESGITTVGTTNTLTIDLTNRASGQVTTTNATPTTVLTLPLGAVSAVYSLEGFTTARSTSTGDGASYFFYACFKTDGTTATEVGTEYPTFFEDASLITANTTVSASGGSVIVQVVGISGTVHWDGILTFRRVL
jgi:hypothetical protein